jgi:hypothetical protein
LENKDFTNAKLFRLTGKFLVSDSVEKLQKANKELKQKITELRERTILDHDDRQFNKEILK